MTLVVALLLALPAQDAVAVTMDDIVIVYGENRLDGVLQSYGIFIYMEGVSGMTTATVEQVATGNKYTLAHQGGGFWSWSDHAMSFSAFDALYPNTGTTQYHFRFNEGLADNDEVIVGYAVNPPPGFANITYPLHNATGVPLDPTYLWDNIEGMAWAHGKWVMQGSTTVHANVPDNDMTQTTWQPGILSPATQHRVYVGLITITGGQPLYLQTLRGEEFTYYGLNEKRDGKLFTTVPEPMTVGLVGTAVLGLVGWRRRRMIT